MTSYSNRSKLIVLINKKGNPIKKLNTTALTTKFTPKKKTFIAEGFLYRISENRNYFKASAPPTISKISLVIDA